MKKTIALLGLFLIIISCEQPIEKARAIDSDSRVKAEKIKLEERLQQLKEEGHQTFIYKEGDSTYLMQQYFMVFLKSGDIRSQDSTEAAELQKKHLAYLNRMAREGYASLIGPFGDDGEIRGIVVYNTPTQKEADSLANLDPMVKAGRLKVEVHPWWTEKGGKLN
ncbi:MAG: YciI family protein [Gillisia sp.]|nr:YciI family protein [Gillisia sp.]